MTPQEIAQLKKQSPLLIEALSTEKKLYHFLRQIDVVDCSGLCDLCKACDVPTLQTAYTGRRCIQCTLEVFRRPEDAEHYDPRRDPRSSEYDASYDAQYRMWDDWPEDIPLA